MQSVDEGTIEKAIEALVKKVHGGDVVAIRELLDPYFGRPATHDLAARVEALEMEIIARSHGQH